MRAAFLETGQIVNTHGVRGEVKILPWADAPEFLLDFGTLYIDEKPIRVLSARVHKNCVLATLDGISSVDAAMSLKGKTVYVARKDVNLPEGRYFLADLIGLEVRDADSDALLGTLADVLTPPAHNIYVVKGHREYLIPAVDAFIVETDPEKGFMRVRLLEGM